MRTLPALTVIFFYLMGFTHVWQCAYAKDDFCKWIDAQGVTHYATECPENEETQLIGIQAPLTEAQQEAARQRSESLLKRNRTSSPSKSPSLHRFRSLPADRLGPMPENTESKFLKTTGTGILFNKDNQGRFTLSIVTLEGLPTGSYLEVHFPDPSNPANKNTVGKEVQTERDKLLFESPTSNQFRCWNYEVLVNVYSDSTMFELLDTHYQFIQSRHDLRLFEDNSPFLLQMVGGAKCPTSGKEKMSRMSIEQLETLCEQEREKRLKPERERLIKNCVEKMDKSEEYCANFYADHGDAVRVDRAHVRPALYYDLPECIAARKARVEEK